MIHLYYIMILQHRLIALINHPDTSLHIPVPGPPPFTSNAYPHMATKAFPLSVNAHNPFHHATAPATSNT